MKISQVINLYKNFGFEITLSSVFASMFRSASDWRHRDIMKYLKENYKDFISEYQNKKYPGEHHNSKIIWTLWWQGDSEKILPPTVKLCFDRMKRNCGSHELKILTKDNYHEYVKMPKYILDKVNSGQITLTHFSDLIRMYLLLNHGGLWLDATIFTAGKIPEEIFDLEYFTIRRVFDTHQRNISKGRWTSFLHAAKSNTALCDFVYNFFLEYWKHEKILIHYHLIDYTIATAFEEISECNRLMNSVPLNNPEMGLLDDLMSKKFDEDLYKQLTENTIFFKLAWRTDYKKSIADHETFYGHLLKEANLN